MKKPIIVNKLSDHGSIIHSKFYKSAHQFADKQEKNKYPKDYEILKKAIPKLGKHELMGKMNKSGRVEVNAKFKSYAPEIAYHEKQEHKKFRQLKSKR